MNPEIKKILKTNQVDGIFHTHVSMINPKGKFQFNRPTLEQFWTAYCDFIESDEDAMVGIAEKPQQYLPVLVDVDLRVRDEGSDSFGDALYTDEQLETIVETYQSTLRQIVDGCSDDDLICAVLEKNMYQQTKNEIVYFKHGFHLHFPCIFLNKVDQEIQLIPRVQQTLKELKLFENLGLEDSGAVIDRVCCKVPWLLYGSRKTEENHPYKLTKFYDANMNIISPEKALKHYQIFDHKEQVIPIRGKIAYYLPRIFSIVPYGRSTKEIKRGVISPIKEKLKKERKSSTTYRTMSVEEAINIARRLLPMLADHRADDYNEWMTIGWCLFNITEGHPDGLDLWCEFSSRSEDKYDENACIYQWERMTKRDLTIGTLRHYASIDNPVEYKKYKEEETNKHIMTSLDGSHNDVAKALHAEYNDEFVCASVANKVWFQFINHKWEQIEEGTFLREKISGKIVDRYFDTIKKLYDELRGCQDKAREAMTNARIKQVQKMIGNLKSAPYKNNVMKECLKKGTLVTLESGLSMKIEDMIENQRVLCWDAQNKGLYSQPQCEFLPKGVKKCIKISLQDGTTLSVTPDHKILLGDQWVCASTLKVGDKLQTSIKGPVYQYNPPAEVYTIQVGELIFSNKTAQENAKLLALARVLGFILSDGSISVDEHKSCVSFSHKMDVDAFRTDVQLLTNKTPKIYLGKSRPPYSQKSLYHMNIPLSFSKGIATLKGIPVGRRTENPHTFPDFIMNPNCPIDVVREFIAGLWGGDGHRPTYNKTQNIMRSVGISKTKEIRYEEALDLAMNNLGIILSRFGVENVTHKKGKTYTSRGKTFVEKILYIGMSDYLKFAENIGIRYCSEKNVRLNLFTSYLNMRRITEKQYNQVVERIKKLQTNRPVKDVIDEAFFQICQEEPVLCPEYVKPKYSTVMRQLRTNCNSHKFQNGFPKPIEYFSSLGACNFLDKYIVTETIPTFSIPIVDIRDDGEHEVYDINVLESHSFVANGVVVHNCMEVFYDPRFREKLDADPYLIAFKNGVYDLKLNNFRPGRPEDFLSKSMPINYVTYTEDDEKVGDVYTFLEQVFPDKSVRKYFLDVSSDIFVGGNHEKIVLFWTGEGDNGKSITQLFFELMMGKLAIKLNTNVITGKKPSAGAAFADLARAGGGVRWAVLEEPDADEMINTGIFKHLSGNDTFYARDLFEKGKDGREICPMFKLAFICLAKGTPVSLPSGISISIEKLANNTRLLGYDESRNGLASIKQQKLLSQGEQSCITLTLQDGRKITCTPNHKFLTASGEWIQAENVVPGVTTLKMGVDNPICDDMFEESNFKLCDFNLNTRQGKLQAMALCRLIGYVITDGTLNKTLYIGHQIDAENILCDIELLSGKRPKIIENHRVLQIAVPEELSRMICLLTEKQTGGKVNCSSSYPEFVFDPSCPLYLVREFLASIFGGDGIVPPVLRNRIGSLQFVASKTGEHVESLTKNFERFSTLLKDRFNIEANVTQPVLYDNNKFNVFLRINKAQDILRFAENIGFRYCCHKTYRMTAVASLLRYKNAIIAQNQDIISRANVLYETTGQTREQAFNQAVRETPFIIDPEHLITYNRARVHYLIYKNNYKMPSICVRKFLDRTGLDKFTNKMLGKGKVHYSVDSEDTILPCYKMIVVGKEESGQKNVYDIVAEEPYSNFVANGAVTHNCNKLPRIKAADKAVWNRVRVIPFEATFCRPDNPAPESYEEQLRQKRFPMDKQFSKKIPGLVEAFAWVLLQHRMKIANRARIEPEKVRAATEIYRRQNDIYRQFIEECIIEDPEKFMSLAELYNLFKDWFKESLPGHSVPVKNEIEEYFCKIWGPTEGKKWAGYRQKTIKDDIANGDAIILTEDDLIDDEKKDD